MFFNVDKNVLLDETILSYSKICKTNHPNNKRPEILSYYGAYNHTRF